MKKLLKPTLIAVPAILALAACDAPPAEAPTADGVEDGTGAMEAPVEEPLDTAPMGEAPVNGNLEGGAAPADELPADATTPPAAEASPPAGEDSATDKNAEEPPAAE